MSSRSRRILLAISLLSVVGVLVSSLSLHHHYDTSPTAYCDLGENFNCDLVNRSTYSTVFRIPVALIGIIGYIALFALATVYRTKRETPAMLLIASLAGLGFAFYLTYIEAFVLAVWCILCLSSQIIIFAISMLSSLLVVHTMRRAGDQTRL